MTAADHLHRAEQLMEAAEAHFREASGIDDYVDRIGSLRLAEVASNMAHARAAIAWASIVDDPDMPHPGPALGVAAPVLHLPMRPDTRRAAPETPETAADTPASRPHEGNVRS